MKLADFSRMKWKRKRNVWDSFEEGFFLGGGLSEASLVISIPEFDTVLL